MENYQTKYKVACKTGSTDYDNLIVAYNPNILINGWVGLNSFLCSNFEFFDFYVDK